MPEYTPTTEQVKDMFHLGVLEVGPEVDVEATLAMFDRWLAARDRENRAIGWDEAAVGISTWPGGDTEGLFNPYRGDTNA